MSIEVDQVTAGSVSDAQDILSEHGAVLVRGTNIKTPNEFKNACRSITQQNKFMPYENDRISPRSVIDEYVYTSTDFSAEANIAVHNECAIGIEWPLYIAFFCELAADQGGTTTFGPVPDVEDCIDVKDYQKFLDNGIRYSRLLGASAGNSVEANFGTAERTAVEQLCELQAIECAWHDNGTLSLIYERPALRVHPRDGKECWFNNAYFWSPIALDPALRHMVLKRPPERRPYMSFFGDGSAISESTIESLQRAYHKELVHYKSRAGDLLILDNMKYVHGREKFLGERNVWTTMINPVAA